MSTRFVKAACINEIQPGTMKCIIMNGRRILLANVQGQFYATDDTCTHEDASLSAGFLKGALVKCPLHGSRFDVRTGEVLDEPAEASLKTYPVSINNNDILINPDP
jgi:nitrite reductase/ring-hydroxylating ferredoxin subunit